MVFSVFLCLIYFVINGIGLCLPPLHNCQSRKQVGL